MNTFDHRSYSEYWPCIVLNKKIIRSFGPSLHRNTYCPKLCNSLKFASLFRNTIDGRLPYINYMVLLNVKLKETGRKNYVITFLRLKLITKKESYNGKWSSMLRTTEGEDSSTPIWTLSMVMETKRLCVCNNKRESKRNKRKSCYQIKQRSAHSSGLRSGS